MSQSTEDMLPPYFNISPDEALAELGAPVGAADFAEIARRCAEGRRIWSAAATPGTGPAGCGGSRPGRSPAT